MTRTAAADAVVPCCPRTAAACPPAAGSAAALHRAARVPEPVGQAGPAAPACRSCAIAPARRISLSFAMRARFTGPRSRGTP